MSENITKHYQELFCVVICKIFIFKSCGRWMKTWPPVACPAPWAEETWLLLPGRGSGLPTPRHSVVTPMRGCQPPAEEARGIWSLLAVLGQPRLACTCWTTPPLSPPAPPLHFNPFFLSQGPPCPLEPAGCSLPSSPLASPHLSHHLPRPLQPGWVQLLHKPQMSQPQDSILKWPTRRFFPETSWRWDSSCDTPSPSTSVGTSPTKLASPKQNCSWNPEFSYLAL